MLMIKVVELGKNGWYLDRDLKISKDGKREKIGNWVLRLNLPQGYLPSFEDIAQWLCIIASLEEKKYPSSKGYKGKNFPREFIDFAMKAGWPFPSVLKKYGL